jgi:uncharacterized coiled-coil protein SlyX
MDELQVKGLRNSDILFASFPGTMSEEDEHALVLIAQRTGRPVFFLTNGATLATVQEADMNAQGWFRSLDPVEVARFLKERLQGRVPGWSWDWDTATEGAEMVREVLISAADYALQRVGLKSEHKHEGEREGDADEEEATGNHEARIRRLEEKVSVIQDELDRLNAEADATAAAEAASQQHIADLDTQVADLKAKIASAPKPDPATADIVAAIETTLQKLKAARQVASTAAPTTTPPGSTDASGASLNPVPPIIPTPPDALATGLTPANPPPVETPAPAPSDAPTGTPTPATDVADPATSSSPATATTPAPGPAPAGPTTRPTP